MKRKFEVWLPNGDTAYATDNRDDAIRFGLFLCALNRVQQSDRQDGSSHGSFIAVYERDPDGWYGNRETGMFTEHYICGDPQVPKTADLNGEGMTSRSLYDALEIMDFVQLAQWLRDNRSTYVLSYRQPPLIFQAIPLPIRFKNEADEAIMVLKFANDLR